MSQAEHGATLAKTISNVSAASTSTVREPEYSSLKKSLSGIHTTPKHDLGSLQVPPPRQDHHGHKRSDSGSSMHVDIPHIPFAAETALAALQFLPTPLIVLSSLKTIVLANEAIGRLLGLQEHRDIGDGSILNVLKGQTLSQIGIDMMQDGVPVWVSWEKFLDNLAAGLSHDTPAATPNDRLQPIASGETTPVAEAGSKFNDQSRTRGRSPVRDKPAIQDTAVDVVISASQLQTPPHHRSHSKHHKDRNPPIHATCRMIISIWTLASERFFTLTFTSGGHSHKDHSNHKPSQSVARTTSTASTKSTQSSHSQTPSSSQTSSAVNSPSELSTTSPAFPPHGAPKKCSNQTHFTDFQKVTRMKDAMLNAMEIPVIAMWRDESVVFPNQPARKLLKVTADPTSDESYDFMSRFEPWTADFSRQLTENENPILKLCRTHKAFSKWQIGLINAQTSKRSIYDVFGRPVFDEKTGEFFAGLVAFKDVTEYTEKIASQNAENEQQFQLICDTMPQLLWTTRADGHHDYFSQRWYDYTGLTPEQCEGEKWVNAFHQDDLKIAEARWQHSLRTGDEYLTEYRCRRSDGLWRWMLGRALPLKDHKTGRILKWFGTCTDIQDIVDARHVSQSARQQLVDVLKHAQMTMFVISPEGTIDFFEGEEKDAINPHFNGAAIIGQPASEFVEGRRLAQFNECCQRILRGESELEVFEMQDERERWFRLRMMPQLGTEGLDGTLDSDVVTGIVGTSMNVTQQKKKEQENIQLLANESAAKEASKMKSSFLANMSHEIRTPIAGVLGMSELLMDTELDDEQSEFAQNIQRSANSLLTVINDILDFSKIESGRLDIEEVQFSLPVVLKDVAKMLSYAAARKNLTFTSEFYLGDMVDLRLLGDPGRIRQILTNLLTNSIKFTSEGYVKMTAKILEDRPDVTLIEFMVEDTGIGIEEEVKKRLFRPFSQADSSTARRFGGTGLGLTISKNLVDLMHGSIWLDTQLNHGTTAVFRIPFKKPEFTNGTHTPLIEIAALPDRLQSELSLSVDDSTRENKGRRPSPPLPHSPQSMSSARATKASIRTQEIARDKFHVLVVEDNAVNQQIAIRFIKTLHFSVSAVWNGKEALEYLLKATASNLSAEEKAKYPVPSIILMDCQMPVLDGYHTTHILRHHAPYSSMDAIRNMPIIAMTASAIQGDREKCERSGMDDYLAKPVKRPVLERMILKWVAADKSQRESETRRKPSLSRTGTDHSSNCADFDAIAASILGPNFGEPALPTRPLPNPHQSAREQRRSSLSKHILAQEIIGAETEAEVSMRRAHQQEQASTLRDAKLLAATIDPSDHYETSPYHTKSSPLVDAGTSPFDTTTSPLPRTFLPHAQDSTTSNGAVLALTVENVEKLNNAASSPNSTFHHPPAEDYFSQPNTDGHGHSPDTRAHDAHRIILPVVDIPGPPPDLASPGVRHIEAKDLPEGTTNVQGQNGQNGQKGQKRMEIPPLRRSSTDKTTRPRDHARKSGNGQRDTVREGSDENS